MANSFEPRWLPTMLGSVPNLKAEKAWNLILTYFPEIPAWPQLTRKSYLESMYAQFSERFPGIVQEGERLYVHRERGLDEGLDALYLAYLEGNTPYGAIKADHAAGLAYLLKDKVPFMQPPEAIKGQITGPISWGLSIVDRNRRPIIYDDVLAEALAHHLYLKAAWQEEQLARFADQTIIFVDEPSLSSFDSTVAAISREQLVALLEEVLSAITGLKGLHCCGRTDWGLVLSTSVDVISLNAYAHAKALFPYIEALRDFVERGGIVAWGIVPASQQAATETVESLCTHLEDTLDQLVEAGVPREPLFKQGLVTPSCHVDKLSLEMAERVFYLTAGVSSAMQEKYVQRGS